MMGIIQEIKEDIESLQAQLKDIQEQCTHPKACVTKKYDGNTGNYDPSADCYWINHHCELCDKRWTTDQ